MKEWLPDVQDALQKMGFDNLVPVITTTVRLVDGNEVDALMFGTEQVTIHREKQGNVYRWIISEPYRFDRPKSVMTDPRRAIEEAICKVIKMRLRAVMDG